MFSWAWHWLPIFPPLALIACFPVLSTGCMFSSTWHRLRVFLCLAQVACFSALGTGCVFSRACYWLTACFAALVTGCMFCRPWHWSCFPVLGTGCIFSCTWQCLLVSYACRRLALVVYVCFEFRSIGLLYLRNTMSLARSDDFSFSYTLIYQKFTRCNRTRYVKSLICFCTSLR